jgi:hypothetical protein
VLIEYQDPIVPKPVASTPTLPVWPGHTRRHRWSRICTRHMCRHAVALCAARTPFTP